MYIDILILSQVIHGPKHGYEIKKNVAYVLGKSNTINNNYLYPALKRFEEMGVVEKRLELQEGKPNRHIYSITELGKEVFFELLREFPEEYARIPNEIYNRLAFFDLLDTASKRHILESRMKVVAEDLDYNNQMSVTLKNESFMPFSSQLYTYTRGMMEQEYAILKQLEEDLEDED
ncbi:MAG: hypothetical protein K0R57_3 [Paenibacillaceae bacterium]|nr:hypothetical protein [Paenibacillaceae bacterium]